MVPNAWFLFANRLQSITIRSPGTIDKFLALGKGEEIINTAAFLCLSWPPQRIGRDERMIKVIKEAFGQERPVNGVEHWRRLPFLRNAPCHSNRRFLAQHVA